MSRRKAFNKFEVRLKSVNYRDYALRYSGIPVVYVRVSALRLHPAHFEVKLENVVGNKELVYTARDVFGGKILGTTYTTFLNA